MLRFSRLFKPAILLAGLIPGSAAHLSAQQTQQPPASSSRPPTANPDTGDSVSIERDVQYGVQGGEKLLLDIYEPAFPSASPRPAVVLIHGGSWNSLDKSTMQGMGNFLARTGFVAFSVNYRLLHENENRWPAQLDDVQRAVRWMRANAAKYGIDPNHIGAFGHSAGAQLAALLGMQDTRDNSDPALAKFSSRVQAVVDVSGPTDFLVGADKDGESEMADLFGGDAAKIPEVWQGASPAFQVAKSNAPFLIVHGTADTIVSIAQAQELYDKLQLAGVPVTFIKVDDGHTFAAPDARRRLAFESLKFFQHYLLAGS